MAEEEASVPAQPRLRVINQYVRDLSFENIAAQKGLSQEVKPEISVQVNLDAKDRKEDKYEVIIKLNIEAKAGEDNIFILELDYAGVFHVENVTKEQLHPFLLIECPRMLFPYVRRIVGDVSRDGGYPPLNLDNIDFLALYRNEIMRRQAAAAPANGEAAET